MARQTRQQRQARRQRNGGATAETLPVAPERAPAEAGRGAPPKPPRTPREGRPERPARRGNFLQESAAELKKVEWPSQNQVIQGTVVVLIACFVVGVFLYGADQAFKHLVNDVFLR